MGQGAIAVTTRSRDAATELALAAILDGPTGIALACERAFLTRLDGSCRTPIAGHAVVVGGTIDFRGMVLAPDGSDSVETMASGIVEDAARLGLEAAEALLAGASRAVAGSVLADRLRPVRVALFRARADGERTADRLRALGHDPVLAPVIEVVATGAPIASGDFDGVVFTSGHAVERMAFDQRRERHGSALLLRRCPDRGPRGAGGVCRRSRRPGRCGGACGPDPLGVAAGSPASLVTGRDRKDTVMNGDLSPGAVRSKLPRFTRHERRSIVVRSGARRLGSR